MHNLAFFVICLRGCYIISSSVMSLCRLATSLVMGSVISGLGSGRFVSFLAFLIFGSIFNNGGKSG